MIIYDCLAEWSKAVALGAIPKGQGFKPLSSHYLIEIIYILLYLFIFASGMRSITYLWADKYIIGTPGTFLILLLSCLSQVAII